MLRLLSFSSVGRAAVTTPVVVAAPLVATQFVLPRFYAIKTVNTPHVGDSIVEGAVSKWNVGIGQGMEVDTIVAVLETDKTNVEIRATEAGVMVEHCVPVSESAKVGQPLYKMDVGAVAAGGNAAPTAAAAAPATAAAPAAGGVKPGVKPGVAPGVKPGSTTSATPAPAPAPAAAAAGGAAPKAAAAAGPAVPFVPKIQGGARVERRERLSRMRLKIADRLKDAQNTAAMLTTFQDCDMSALMALREKHKEAFEKKHGVKLGFMSAFVKASAAALMAQPAVNASIDGTDIVYHDYADISVAVATPTGLVVPVIRNCDSLSFADVEKTINDFGVRAKENKLAREEMEGGTFTISNGGVFGSLMGTPILNPPQSAILGMHAINKRPVAVGDKVEIRPMMYLALTYDHRIIDGRDAVTFLKRVRTAIEDPVTLLLDM